MKTPFEIRVSIDYNLVRDDRHKDLNGKEIYVRHWKKNPEPEDYVWLYDCQTKECLGFCELSWLEGKIKI